MADIKIAQRNPHTEETIADFLASHIDHPECYQLPYHEFILYVVAWIAGRKVVNWRRAREIAVVIAVRKEVRETIPAPDPQSLANAVRELDDTGRAAFFLALLGDK